MTNCKHWLILLLSSLTISIHAQIIDLPSGSLSNALESIEKSSEWLFNFNPDLISPFQLDKSHKIDLQQIESSITELLAPFYLNFEIKGNVILISPPEEINYRLCGYIRDVESGDPLEYVNLFTSALQGTWTDDNGYFEMDDPIGSNQQLNISYIGYQEKIIPASTFKSGCQEIFLETEIQDFPVEVIIRDYFLPSITQGEDYSVINLDMSSLHREMGAIERDVLKTIQFIPGITSLDETAGNITIRGSIPDQNLILWESTPMYNSSHLFGMVSSINPFIISDLNVHKGVYSPAYENRIGGVLDIKLPHEPEKKLSGALGTTMTEAHGELVLPILQEKLSIHLAGRRSIADIIEHNPTFESYGRKLFKSSEYFGNEEEDEEEDEFATDLNYSDVTGKIIYKPNAHIYWSSSFLKTKNSFEHAFDFGNDEPMGGDFLFSSTFIWSNLLARKWNENSKSLIRLNFTDYTSQYDFNFDESSQSTSSIIRTNANDIQDFQVKIAHQHELKNTTLEAGYVYDFKELSYSIAEESRFEEDVQGGEDQKGNFHHFYMNSNWYRGDWLINLGARTSFWDEGESIVFSPRFTISRSLTDHLNIKISGGLFNQYIRQLEQFNESALNIENRIWVLATDELMTSSKLSLGFNFQKNGWLIEIDTYYNSSDGVPVLTTGQSSELEINSNGNTSSKGVELLIKRRANSWNSALSYHLGQVDFKVPALEDNQFPGNNDQRHNLSWINYYNLNSWSFGLQYQFRSGLPFTQIDDLTLVEEDEEDYYEVVVEGLNDLRLSNYHRLDLYIGYQKWLSDNSRFDLQLSLLNIFNFQNTTSRNYVLSEAISGNEPEIFEVEKLQLGRTPQLLMRVSF